MASYEEGIEFRRAYGRPGCFIRAAVTDADHEAFLMEELSGISRAPRVDPHLAMKKIKAGP
ncbi:hypothetical protein ABT382_18225 [Streptomyces pharetrae]|uniref:hypothetical protein n=1 Tax=Streptomyces pharetrae TaxID=291370 RepID=UPI0033490E59